MKKPDAIKKGLNSEAFEKNGGAEDGAMVHR